MNKTALEEIVKVKEILDSIDQDDYGLEYIKHVYEYPAQVIPAFPAITIEFDTCVREDITLGDNRYLETYNVRIVGYIAFIDTKENYIALLKLDRAIKEALKTNRILDTGIEATTYWRNSTIPSSDYSTAKFEEFMCRSVTLTWSFEQVVIP